MIKKGTGQDTLRRGWGGAEAAHTHSHSHFADTPPAWEPDGHSLPAHPRPGWRSRAAEPRWLAGSRTGGRTRAEASGCRLRPAPPRGPSPSPLPCPHRRALAAPAPVAGVPEPEARPSPLRLSPHKADPSPSAQLLRERAGAAENGHNCQAPQSRGGGWFRSAAPSAAPHWFRPGSSHPPACPGGSRASPRSPAAASPRARPQRHLAPGPPPPQQQLSAADSHFRGKRQAPPRRRPARGRGLAPT